DEEDHGHAAEKGEEHGANVARGILMKQSKTHGGGLGGEFGELRAELSGEGVEFGLGLGGRDAGAETGNEAEEAEVAREGVEIVRKGREGLQVCGNAGIAGENQTEATRKNADNDELAALVTDRLADDGRIGGEAAAPEVVAEDEGALGALRLIGWSEVAAEVRRDTENAEEIRG